MTILRSTVRKHFEAVAPRYRVLRDLDVRVVPRFVEILERLAQPNRRLSILDVGAGTGRYTEAVLSALRGRILRACFAVGYDATYEMLRSGIALEQLSSRNPIARVSGLAEALPFSTRSFDAVMSFNAVHHFDLRGFLAEAGRVLRPHGMLAIYTRTPDQNRRTIWGEFFPEFASREQRLYTAATLRAAVQGSEEFRSVRLVEMPWMIQTDASRLLEQAGSKGYSTFLFYARDEFEKALATFRARLEQRYPRDAPIRAQNDHLLLLATRDESPAPS